MPISLSPLADKSVRKGVEIISRTIFFHPVRGADALLHFVGISEIEIY